jgi:hypothetical protein
VGTSFAVGCSRGEDTGGSELAALPPEEQQPLAAGSWTFDVSDENSPPTDPNTWLGLSEDQVFLKRLTHTQKGNDWTIKIGKGGQIYSVSTPQTGEMIAIQRIKLGQWVDEVLQHAIPSNLHHGECLSSSPIVDGDIHQAGYYTISDLDRNKHLLEKSVYSPVFPVTELEFLKQENSFSLMTWPQHAHLPRTYTENGMFMQQSTRDLGDGVVEVNLLVTKWHGEDTKAINVPWSAWRKQTLPVTLLSTPDGSYKVPANIEKFGCKAKPDKGAELGMRFLKKAGTPGWTPETGGWIAMAQSAAEDSHGIGIVFGRNASDVESDGSYLRWGEYGSDADGGTVATIKRNVALRPGDSVLFRYFMVIGTVSKIRYYGNLLEPRVMVKRIQNQEQQSGLICVTRATKRPLRRGCPEGSSPVFHSYRNFQADSQPLFLLERKAGGYLLTTDPYEISKDPTDGATASMDFLGWAVPGRKVESFSYFKLDDLAGMEGLTLSKTLENLYGRSKVKE